MHFFVCSVFVYEFTDETVLFIDKSVKKTKSAICSAFFWMILTFSVLSLIRFM